MRFCRQISLLMERSTLLTMCVLIFMATLSQFNGNNALTAYIVPIFQTAHSSVDPYTCAIIYGIPGIVGAIANSCLVDRLGRRPLLYTSYLMCSICMAVYGGYLYLLSTGSGSSLGWLPLTAMVIFKFFNDIGMSNQIILRGELLPASVRSLGFSLMLVIILFVSFVSIQTFSKMEEVLGEHVAFWVFSGCSASVALTSTLALPETRGRSLEEITAQSQPDQQQQNCQAGCSCDTQEASKQTCCSSSYNCLCVCANSNWFI